MTRPAERRSSRAASLLGWRISGGATVLWVVAVVASGSVGRVVGHWAAALTMAFGSFLGGSSPLGGGAVAFPVFTKALDVPAPAARTFALCIQAVGLTMAVAAIVVNRRPMHRRGLVLGSTAATVGFVVAIATLGDPGQAFLPMTIGAAWTKATFSIVLASTAILMVRQLRRPEPVAVQWGPIHDLALVGVAVAGGVLGALTGTGANLVVFLFLVVVAGVAPRVALPTAVAVMAVVSCVGFVLLGLIDGQLFVSTDQGRVVEVGGQAVDLATSKADIFGMWLAAVPVVVWGAPLGSLVASKVSNARLVGFVAVLAVVEVVTTVLLVGQLRRSPAMAAYLVVGVVAVPAMFVGAGRVMSPEREQVR